MQETIITHYDVAEHLRTSKEMAAYLEACIEEANGDTNFIAKALKDIARAKGMMSIIHDAELPNHIEQNFDFATLFKIIGALGLKLHVKVSHV